MNLVDMTQVGSDSDCCRPVGCDGSPCIYLSSDQCEALGITGMPAPGTVFQLEARAMVTSMTASAEDPSEGEGDAPDISVSLKLVALGVAPDGGASAAQVLYGS